MWEVHTVRALGRIGGEAAEELLIGLIADPDSPVRSESARALGKLRSRRAVPTLIDMLSDGDEQSSRAAARALGKIDSNESEAALQRIIRESASFQLKVVSAEGLSAKEERIAVLQEILELYSQLSSPSLRRQMHLALGNIIGRPGEFYRYISGTAEARGEAAEKLFRSTVRHLKSLERNSRGFIDHIVFERMPSAIEHFENGENDLAFNDLTAILSNLVYREITISGVSSMTAEQMLQQAPRLYSAYTLLGWFENHHARGLESLSTEELLLLFYAIRYYRVPFEQSRGRTKSR